MFRSTYQSLMEEYKWKTKCSLLNDFLNNDRTYRYFTRYVGSNLVHVPNGESVFFSRLEETESPFYGDMKSYFKYHKENNYNPTNCDKCKYSDACTCGTKNMVEALKNDSEWKNIVRYYTGGNENAG